ncbi:hypothetical protein AV530_001182 [Patagioenas fasciata monilis]|uniref:Uncharacterized protein n=1 Tax=Patagioenas fasciata monilis TaxID=372326 RepID=A0A1V4KV40_PATFA|nr:hypothetical protein AV530_001182 [Patagioenas fasciata monilis]
MVATIQVLEIRKISLQGVLLLCYAQWCGFCASLVHIYIPLAWLLHPDNFTVARSNLVDHQKSAGEEKSCCLCFQK